MEEGEKERRLAEKDKIVIKQIEHIDWLVQRSKRLEGDLEKLELRLTAMKNSKKTGLAGVLERLRFKHEQL